MGQQHFDLVVLGAGPGGYVAAIRAAQLGLKAAVVEEKYWGGVCLNVGCIPSKALLRNAELAHLFNNEADYFGIKVDGTVEFDYGKAFSRSREVADGRVKGVHFLMKKNKITELNGRGTFVDDHTIDVKGEDGSTEAGDAEEAEAAGEPFVVMQAVGARGVFNNAWSGIVYYWTPQRELVQLSMTSLEKKVVYVEQDPEAVLPGSSVSPDQRYVIGLDRRLTGPGSPIFQIVRLDIPAGKREVIFEDPEICNPHLQFNPVTGKQILVQNNRGVRMNPDGSLDYRHSAKGTTLFVIDADGRIFGNELLTDRAIEVLFRFYAVAWLGHLVLVLSVPGLSVGARPPNSLCRQLSPPERAAARSTRTP